MNDVHMPFDFILDEKELVKKYLKKFKHSTLSIIMLKCAYFGSRYEKGYIPLTSYLRSSLQSESNDKALMRRWGVHENSSGFFFNIPTEFIYKKNLKEVEKEISERIYQIDYQRKNKSYNEHE